MVSTSSLTIAYWIKQVIVLSKNIIYGQATKSIRWMPWCQEAMKDVASCDKPRGAAKQASIRGFLNGGTQSASWRIIYD